MRYAVIIESENGAYRARIPALSNLAAEGASREEALQNAQLAAEAYLSKVEIAAIEISIPNELTSPPDSPQSWIKAAGIFSFDDELFQQHLNEIAAEKQRQREESERHVEIPVLE
ncbi:MAG TPA: type II toxin-antitoxin system HicB family antitoxin [Blastocatellia bacterium]|jgi:predicted RNase H-like HicB family nuclease